MTRHRRPLKPRFTAHDLGPKRCTAGGALRPITNTDQWEQRHIPDHDGAAWFHTTDPLVVFSYWPSPGFPEWVLAICARAYGPDGQPTVPVYPTVWAVELVIESFGIDRYHAEGITVSADTTAAYIWIPVDRALQDASPLAAGDPIAIDPTDGYLFTTPDNGPCGGCNRPDNHPCFLHPQGQPS